jgi:hypothetical protein
MFEICRHRAVHVKMLWAFLPFPIYLRVVCLVHEYYRCSKFYSSFWLTLYFELDMCNLQLLLNSDCIKCPPPSVVTWVSEKWNGILGLWSSSWRLWYTSILFSFPCQLVDMTHTLWQSIACSGVVLTCYMLSVWSFQCGEIWHRWVYRYQHFRGACWFHLKGSPRTNCLTVQTEATNT